MLDVQRALLALQLLALWSDGALRQIRLGQVGHALEVVVAGVAEVCGAEAEEDGHGAAVAALVLLQKRITKINVITPWCTKK